MTTTAPVMLTAGQWNVDVEHSTATFTVGNLGHTVTGTVPILDGTVEVGPDGLPSAIYGSLDLSGIATGIHYPRPIHLQAAYAQRGVREGAFPVSERAALQLLSLPMFAELEDESVARIAEAVGEVLSV